MAIGGIPEHLLSLCPNFCAPTDVAEPIIMEETERLKLVLLQDYG